MLCVIAVGVWTIAGLYIYEFINTKDVCVINTIDADVSGKVEVTNEVDVNLEDVLGSPVGTHRTYVDQYGYQHWGIDVIRF